MHLTLHGPITIDGPATDMLLLDSTWWCGVSRACPRVDTLELNALPKR